MLAEASCSRGDEACLQQFAAKQKETTTEQQHQHILMLHLCFCSQTAQTLTPVKSVDLSSHERSQSQPQAMQSSQLSSSGTSGAFLTGLVPRSHCCSWRSGAPWRQPPAAAAAEPDVVGHHPKARFPGGLRRPEGPPAVSSARRYLDDNYSSNYSGKAFSALPSLPSNQDAAEGSEDDAKLPEHMAENEDWSDQDSPTGWCGDPDNTEVKDAKGQIVGQASCVQQRQWWQQRPQQVIQKKEAAQPKKMPAVPWA